jgi:hypothetical protein
MKTQQFKHLIGGCAVAALMLWLPACATQTSNVADAGMESALRTAHFKATTATTAAQRHQLNALPDHQFTMVRQNGDTYYLYPDKVHGRVFAGDHWAYRAFIGNEKNNRLRRQGAFVVDDPSNRADNRTVVVWHDWSPFQQWE